TLARVIPKHDYTSRIVRCQVIHIVVAGRCVDDHSIRGPARIYVALCRDVLESNCRGITIPIRPRNIESARVIEKQYRLCNPGAPVLNGYTGEIPSRG